MAEMHRPSLPVNADVLAWRQAAVGATCSGISVPSAKL